MQQIRIQDLVCRKSFKTIPIIVLVFFLKWATITKNYCQVACLPKTKKKNKQCKNDLNWNLERDEKKSSHAFLSCKMLVERLAFGVHIMTHGAFLFLMHFAGWCEDSVRNIHTPKTQWEMSEQHARSEHAHLYFFMEHESKLYLLYWFYSCEWESCKKSNLVWNPCPAKFMLF